MVQAMASEETAGTDWQPGPARPRAPDGELHLWRLDLDRPEPEPDVLSAAERERRERLVSAQLRRRWGNSRRGLREVLGGYLGQPPAAVELALSEQGKPELAGTAPPLRFNLSHSGGLALVVVSAQLVVGVDVERIEPRRNALKLAARMLAPAAVEAVRAAAPERRDAVFLAAWTEYEARLKCAGGGIGGGEPQGPVTVAPVAVGAGYAGAIAVAGATLPAIRRFELAPR